MMAASSSWLRLSVLNIACCGEGRDKVIDMFVKVWIRFFKTIEKPDQNHSIFELCRGHMVNRSGCLVFCTPWGCAYYPGGIPKAPRGIMQAPGGFPHTPRDIRIALNVQKIKIPPKPVKCGSKPAKNQKTCEFGIAKSRAIACRNVVACIFRK